ncbi:thioredoxin SoxW [hydrothermal vent metagenome]|uniref:Thioredoxin SoxW n=1 Tax=hydrothermal vent metagenome TaxID=652676 RepID=A0A3B0Y3G4_9ZZZZ
MMKRNLRREVLAFICLLSLLFLVAANKQQLTAGMVNPGHHDKPSWFKLSFLDIRDDIAEATTAKKRLILYFYQDGCPYCKKLLEDNFGQRAIANKTRQHFEVVAINMWGSKEVTDLQGKVTTEKKFATSLKVQFTPTLLFFDEKGKVIVRVNGYYYPQKFMTLLNYVSGKLEKSTSFRAYLKKTSPAKANNKLQYEEGFLKPPYNLQKILSTSSKPLMVLFEQKHCKSCDELHKDIFKRKASRYELAKFNVLLVDMWSRDKIILPNGSAMTMTKWASQLKILSTPSMVFFNKQGKEVFRSEAYLKSFHVNGSMGYVSEGAYLTQPNFQRYLQARRHRIEKKGGKVDLMH